jgi:hypothetical protein
MMTLIGLVCSEVFMSQLDEISLWRAVIDRAARDAFGYSNSRINQHNALRWFFNNHPRHFRRVCEFADLDPDAVLDCFIKALLTKDFKYIQHAMRW